MDTVFRSYKKEFDYTYALGAAPTIELLQAEPGLMMKVFVDPSFLPSPAMESVERLCADARVPLEVNARVIARLSPKENCFVVGVFYKFDQPPAEDRPHVVLVNPSDMGNAGTILRTMVGFGLADLAVISPGVDLFHPRVVRSSMGAISKVAFRYYDDFAAYRKVFPAHEVFPFMLDGAVRLQEMEQPVSRLYSLVFGNEATGLDPSYRSYGKSVCIGHSRAIDSLNLSNAVSIAIYEFTKYKTCGIINEVKR